MARIIQTADLTESRIAALASNDRDWIYNGLDCCVTLEILGTIKPQLDDLSKKTYAFSLALQGPVMEMQVRGVRIDLERRNQVLAEYLEKIRRVGTNLTRIVKEGVGVDLNWRSPKQLGQLLYDVMGIPAIRKRSVTGRMVRTTDRDALERLQNYYFAEPICLHILALRDLDKKRQFLETQIDADKRIRCNFNIAGTNTGRLASSVSDFSTGRNLQNIDTSLRSVFIADPGMKMANLDLEQADSRNLGALCWNLFVESHGPQFAGAYLDACESGDLHTKVCQMANPELAWTNDPKTNRAIADVIYYRGKTYRDKAKTLGHGTNFIGQAPTMARHSKFPVNDIRVFMSNYFAAFPCISEYHKYVRYQLQHFGHLVTLLGRRRFFFGRYKDEKTVREAVAYSPQSMTADEIDTGIMELFHTGRVQLLIQVHDSILFQFPEELEDIIIPWAIKALTVRVPLLDNREYNVPVEAKTGWNWGDKKESNPGGLVNYTGTDLRTRPKRTKPTQLSIRHLLGKPL